MSLPSNIYASSIFDGASQPAGLVTITSDVVGSQNYACDLNQFGDMDYYGGFLTCGECASNGQDMRMVFTDTEPLGAMTNADLPLSGASPLLWFQFNMTTIWSAPIPFLIPGNTLGPGNTGGRNRLGRWLWLHFLDGTALQDTQLCLTLLRRSGMNFHDVSGLVALP
jgi:hypothetical protein